MKLLGLVLVLVYCVGNHDLIRFQIHKVQEAFKTAMKVHIILSIYY